MKLKLKIAPKLILPLKSLLFQADFARIWYSATVHFSLSNIFKCCLRVDKKNLMEVGI